MSEQNFDLASEMFDPPSADVQATYDDTGYEDDPADWSDEDLAAYLGSDDDSDDEDYGQPPDIETLVEAGLAQGLDPYIAGAQAKAEADAWWNNWQMERDYREHVDYQQRLGEASEQAQGLIQEAAQRHDVPQSAADGTLERVANFLLTEAQRAAYDTGNTELLAWLQSPAGAERAIDAAGQACYVRAVSEVGTAPGVDRVPNNAHSAKMRAAFDSYMRR